MTISELGSIGELVAAIATIATLGYLAIQIRQSNRSNEVIAISRIAESSEGWLGQIARDAELYDLYRRGSLDADSLSREEFGRFSMLLLQFLRGTESGWLQVRLNLIDADYWLGMERSIAFIIGSPAGRRVFHRNREFLTPAFADDVDRILSNNGGTDDSARRSLTKPAA